MRVLIIGCGYVGMPLGRLLVQQGHCVVGMRRSADVDGSMADLGITPLHADITNAKNLAGVESNFDVVINLVSSSKGGVDEYRRVYLEGTRNILEWLAGPVFYIHASSTSVYAQGDGSWVREESETAPESETSQVLVQTEELLGKREGFPAVILRLSGIYGPERGHLFKQFLRGEATLRDDGNSWINMVHVEDAARAVAHFVTHRGSGGVFNVTDDEPVTQNDFFSWLATKLNRPMPPSLPADPNRKRGLTNKRVSNGRLKAAGFSFRYPTFREGYGEEIERLGLNK